MMVPSIQIINIEKEKEKKGVTSLIIWGILGVLVTVFSILIICTLEPTVNKARLFLFSGSREIFDQSLDRRRK